MAALIVAQDSVEETRLPEANTEPHARDMSDALLPCDEACERRSRTGKTCEEDVHVVRHQAVRKDRDVVPICDAQQVRYADPTKVVILETLLSLVDASRKEHAHVSAIELWS